MEFSCLSGNVQMVKFLLDQGVDPNTRDMVHYTAFGSNFMFVHC